MSADKIDTPVMVLLDTVSDGDKVVPTTGSLKLMGLARNLTSSHVFALALDQRIVTEAVLSAGADTVLIARAEGFSSRIPAAVADALLAACATSPQPFGAVLAESNYLGKAASAIFAVRQGSGAVADIASLAVSAGSLVATKSVLAGTWSTDVQITRGVPMFAVRAGVGALIEYYSTAEQQVRQLDFELSPAARSVVVQSSTRAPQGERIGLGEADVAVVAGRGIDGDTELVFALADILGAGVGATRVVCDEGWLPRSTQIGQTGLSISPKLYIGLGVSGAVHHTCGMLGSQRIVAVVDDPDAPILELADFAVVGDVSEVIPQAIRALSGEE